MQDPFFRTIKRATAGIYQRLRHTKRSLQAGKHSQANIC